MPLEWGDEELYHVVTDTYILSFLPMIGDLLPRLEITPKDADGNPLVLENMLELTVSHRGRELKVWETVAEYAASLPPGEDGLPVIPDDYRQAAGRIKQVPTFPMVGWVYLAVGGISAGTDSTVVGLAPKERQKARGETSWWLTFMAGKMLIDRFQIIRLSKSNLLRREEKPMLPQYGGTIRRMKIGCYY